MRTRPNRATCPERAVPNRKLARVGLVALSLCALAFQGCASLGIGNGCGNGCGAGGLFKSCGAKWNAMGQRLFHRKTVIASDSCDPGLGSMPMESGGVIIPSGPVLQAPPADSEPIIQPNAGSLNAPNGSGKAGGNVQGANSGAVKSFYQTQNARPSGEASMARREAAPTTTSASKDPLADIPSLTSPKEATPAAESSPPSAPTAGDRPAPEKPETAATKPADITAGLAPGIRRFRVIEPQLAVGSLPSENGWKWLSDLRYKTVIDLRPATEVRQSELKSIDHMGLRYIAIPMPLDTIDDSLMAKLETELAREDARPVFVFDSDGIRPAAAGYLHLATVRKVDSHTAERELEELGASETPLWRAAVDHFSKTKAAAVGNKIQEKKEAPAPGASAPGIISAWESIKPASWGSVAVKTSAVLNFGGQAMASLPVVLNAQRPSGPVLAD
jgi:protein tyrosine phosphatase (PTP) superfamily phosphohydrolase (DUF442 family)